MPRLSSLFRGSGGQVWLERLEKDAQPPIHTVEDLLERDAATLAKQCKCHIDEIQSLKQKTAIYLLSPPSSSSAYISFEDHDRLSLAKAVSITAKTAIPSGEDMAEYEHTHPPRPSGNIELDSLFCGGGYPAGHLISILGEARSGKTQIAIHAVVHAAIAGLKVLYINSTNDFSWSVAEKLIQQHLLQMKLSIQQHLRDGKEVDSQMRTLVNDPQEQRLFVNHVLNQIELSPCFDIWQAMDLFSSIQSHDRKYHQSMREMESLHTSRSDSAGNEDSVRRPYDLIVVDCFHHWVAPYLHDSSATERVPFGAATISAAGGAPTAAMVVNVHPFISEIHLLMKSISVESATTIIVTNVLNKDHLQYHRQRSFGPQSRTQSTSGSMSAGGSINNSMITNKLSIATGTGGPSQYLDMYDIVMISSATTVKSSVNDLNNPNSLSQDYSQSSQGPSVLETRIELGKSIKIDNDTGHVTCNNRSNYSTAILERQCKESYNIFKLDFIVN